MAPTLLFGPRVKHSILLIDDDNTLLKAMRSFLESEGFLVWAVANGHEAAALLRQRITSFSLALVDFHMPEVSGTETTRLLRAIDEDLCILTFSGDDSVAVHAETLESGASFVISKATENDKLIAIVHRICRDVEKRRRPVRLVGSADNRQIIAAVDMIGASEHLASIARLIQKVAPLEQSVLILGENGTGKEKVAQAIHKLSPRRRQPFIAVNCGAFAKDLIGSELFGHQRGAFTGAVDHKVGKFQAAHGGTIFLDEIGEMPTELQVVLLRVLQEKVVTPLGSNEPKKVDVRVIAATNANLPELIRQGRFREDLFYRLNGLPIHLLPLRERVVDIPELAVALLERFNQDQGTTKILTPSAVDQLCRSPWPGNVRELQNTIFRLASLTEHDEIVAGDLRPAPSSRSVPSAATKNLDHLRNGALDAEERLIEETLRSVGSISEAARKLGLSRSTLRDRLKKFGITVNRKEEPT